MFKMNFKKVTAFCLLVTTATGIWAQSFLHTEGQDIVNEKGEKVFFRGVGLGNWMLPEGYMWKFGEEGDRPRKIEKLVSSLIGQEAAADFWKSFRANYITETDIARIAELGYNSVRPALNSRLLISEGENNEFLDEGFLLLDQLIEWCKKYRIYVIIDMHGAPGGQTGQNIDDSPNDIPELFTLPKNQDLLEKLWVKIAKRYKNEPIVAAYDLLNEPLPENTGAAEKYKDQLVPLYRRLIKAIRKVDQKHMFTIEGYNWANNWSLFDKPLDTNMFFQFHYYCWDHPDNLNDISYFIKKRDQLNTPVWVGETGEKDNTIYFATTQYFEKNNIGWSFWPWKKMDTSNTPYSIKPPEGWEKVTSFSHGGKKPSEAEAKKMFAELEENIKLENCVFFPDVVNAMFRRIPLKIEAENYGQEGNSESYFVKDSLTMASFYRKREPVKITVIENEREEQGQAIELITDEWTAYQFSSPGRDKYNITIRIKAVQQPALIVFQINGKQTEIKITETGWDIRTLKPEIFKKGRHEIKVMVKNGKVDLDWININKNDQ